MYAHMQHNKAQIKDPQARKRIAICKGGSQAFHKCTKKTATAILT